MMIFLVACVSIKADRPMAAAELYRSDWFMKARAYVERTGARWFILSAAYGLVAPDALISPYNVTLRGMAVADRRRWGLGVIRQLQCAIRVDDPGPIVFLAGRLYREPLLAFAGDRAAIPMKGMGIGEQKRWLAQQACA